MCRDPVVKSLVRKNLEEVSVIGAQAQGTTLRHAHIVVSGMQLPLRGGFFTAVGTVSPVEASVFHKDSLSIFLIPSTVLSGHVKENDSSSQAPIPQE